jgi:hypothetical protein
MPFLVLVVKNMRKYFSFEVTVLDDKGARRRFRASNYQSATRVKPFVCTMPMRLDEGWNQIQVCLFAVCAVCACDGGWFWWWWWVCGEGEIVVCFWMY